MNAVTLWDLRMNENKCDKDDIIKQFKLIAKKFVFQLEEGESGYRHWQCRISLIKNHLYHIYFRSFLNPIKSPHSLQLYINNIKINNFKRV
jgi:hypothetical protein